jgi:hypothetical protein
LINNCDKNDKKQDDRDAGPNTQPIVVAEQIR